MSVPPGMYTITNVFNEPSQAPHGIFKQPLSEAMDFVDCCVTLFFGGGAALCYTGASLLQLFKHCPYAGCSLQRPHFSKKFRRLPGVQTTLRFNTSLNHLSQLIDSPPWTLMEFFC